MGADVRLDTNGAENAEPFVASGVVSFLEIATRTANARARKSVSVGKFMSRELHQVRHRSTAVHRITAAGIIMLLVFLSCCRSEQAVGDEKTARQRFVVEVSGVIRMNSVAATDTGEVSRIEISSAAEVVMALSSPDESATSSDSVFLLHSGHRCYLSIHRGPEPLNVQTISLSGQPCLELADEATPVLTITSI